MWFLISLLAAVFYASLWLFARASRGMPSSIVTVIQFSPGLALLAWSIPTVDFPWDMKGWYAFLALQFLILPPLVWAMNFASQRIEVTLIKPLSSLSSISAAITGIVLFGEHLSPWAIMGILVSTAGLLLLYHARWNVWKSPYPWIVLTGVAFFGLNAAFMGYILSVWPHPIAMSGLAMSSICIFAMIQAIRSHKHMRWTKRRIQLLASFAFANLTQELMTQWALLLAPASLVISVKRSSIILAAVAGYFLLHEREIPLKKLLVATLLTTAGIALLIL